MLAVKLWSQSELNPSNYPSYWPWKVKNIIQSEVSQHEQDNWTIYSDDEFNLYKESKQKDFDTWYASLNSNNLRINGLIQDKFKDYHPSKVDFTFHLKPNICLQKKKIMALNGRPVKSEYYYNNEKICEIVFEFTADQLNFMTRRKEKLGYVNFNGEIPEYFYIYDQTYSYTIETQFAEMITERAQARAIIFDSIKAICSGYLTGYYMYQGQTYSQVLQTLGNFWESYSNSIDSWVNTGTPSLATKLTNEDEFSLLDVLLPSANTGLQSNMSVRNYVIYRINY